MNGPDGQRPAGARHGGEETRELGLREREQTYRQIFDATSDALFVHDDKGRFVLVNAQMCAMFGCTAEEALALGVGDLSLNEPPYTEAEALAHWATTMREGSCSFEWRGRRRNGQLFWTEVALRRFDLLGQPHIVASVRDIDARKQMQEALRRSEEQLGKIFNATSTMLAFTEPSEGRIADINEAWRLASGLRRDEAIGRTGSELGLWKNPADREPIVAEIARSGRVHDVEAELVMGGRAFPALMSAERVDLGGTRYILWEVRDLSERKRAEREQELLRAQLLQAQKMESVGQLAGGIAHDFNNILTIVSCYTNLVAKALRPGDPLLDHLGEIRRAGERATALTRQLLAFSRKQVMQLRVLEPMGVLRAMEPMLGRIIGEHIELVVVPSASTRRIKADVAHLEQAIMNLVVNARDAMLDGGKLTIEVADVDVDESYAAGHLDLKPGPHVLIAVSDTGTGMDLATRARAFEPFFTTKGPGRGTGLGLSTVFGIVRQSGGAIWLYSEPGRGTTFKLLFPLTSDPLPQPATTRADRRARRGAQTVLVTEDEPQVRVLVQTILRDSGYTVLDAAGPVEALELAEKHAGQIDLLLTDVVMPQMTGAQLAQRLILLRPRLRVLYMSGYTENTIVHHGVVDENVDFLPKPFTTEQVLAAVARVLERPAATA